MYRRRLPQLDGGLFLTDGGLETTLIFHRGPRASRLRRLRPAEGRRGHRAAPPVLHAVRRPCPRARRRADSREPDLAGEPGLGRRDRVLARRARRFQSEGDRADGGDPRGVRLRPPDRDQRLRRASGRRLQPRDDADARGGASLPLDADRDLRGHRRRHGHCDHDDVPGGGDRRHARGRRRTACRS